MIECNYKVKVGIKVGESSGSIVLKVRGNWNKNPLSDFNFNKVDIVKDLISQNGCVIEMCGVTSRGRLYNVRLSNKGDSFTVYTINEFELMSHIYLLEVLEIMSSMIGVT